MRRPGGETENRTETRDFFLRERVFTPPQPTGDFCFVFLPLCGKQYMKKTGGYLSVEVGGAGLSALVWRVPTGRLLAF